MTATCLKGNVPANYPCELRGESRILGSISGVHIDQLVDNSGVHDLSRLAAVAARFREALVACPRGDFSRFQRCRLSTFPKQCCDVASLLLAYRLRDLGFQNIVRCFGHLHGDSHVWLEVDGTIVDITADQFPSVEDPVIVAETKRSPFHAQIELSSREAALSQPAVRAEYERAYAAIKSWLSERSTES